MISCTFQIPQTFFITKNAYYLPGLFLLNTLLYYLIYEYEGEPILICLFILVTLSMVCIIFVELSLALKIAIWVYTRLLRLCKKYLKGRMRAKRFKTRANRACFFLYGFGFRTTLLYLLLDCLISRLAKVACDFLFTGE